MVGVIRWGVCWLWMGLGVDWFGVLYVWSLTWRIMDLVLPVSSDLLVLYSLVGWCNIVCC